MNNNFSRTFSEVLKTINNFDTTIPIIWQTDLALCEFKRYTEGMEGIQIYKGGLHKSESVSLVSIVCDPDPNEGVDIAIDKSKLQKTFIFPIGGVKRPHAKSTERAAAHQKNSKQKPVKSISMLNLKK